MLNGFVLSGIVWAERKPEEFNYFDKDGKPIPYEPPKDGKAGYSPQKDKKFSVKNDPWANDPANASNLENWIDWVARNIPLRNHTKEESIYYSKAIESIFKEVFIDGDIK